MSIAARRVRFRERAMKRQKEGDKHHYIPKFYLKQWVNPADPNRELCEFSRPYKIVKPRRTDPDGTGYQRGLYTFPKPAEPEPISLM
jgi:hypothetical protein